MKCPRCGNDNPQLFGTIKGRTYCRKCIGFHRVFTDDQTAPQKVTGTPLDVSYTLDFNLSERQELISQTLVTSYESGESALVLAVCGSGKTEISYEVIRHVLAKGGRVCFTIPRKALCQELYDRFVSCFHGVGIGLIYGGHQINVNAPFVICTTHQLYRFTQTPFDLILIDEADAFPFYGDEVLNAMFHQCAGRVYVKMSATLTSSDMHGEKVLIMNRRYHGHDLPVPRILKRPRQLWLPVVKTNIRRMLKNKEKVLVYVPLLSDVDTWTRQLSRAFRVKGVSSHTENINEAIGELKSGQIEALVTTTILERGITVPGAQAIVVHASHRIYDERTLMQISGRVGRKPDAPDGTILFLDESVSEAMNACIQTTEKLNRMSV